jgi:nucleotide-binding universal stress UspA family protein
MRTIGSEAPLFTTVVWATDGSENAARALPYAKALASGDGAMLVAIHIVQGTANRTPGRDSAAETSNEDATTVRKLVGELPQDGMKAILKVLEFAGPQPAQGIADIAQEVGADVIVVGTRERSAVAGLLTGSVTERLIHIAPCPVLSVPPVRDSHRRAAWKSV